MVLRYKNRTPPTLTKPKYYGREVQVRAMLKEGKSRLEIAELLDITPGTVSNIICQMRIRQK